MTIHQPNPPVVVGVDGSEHGHRAVDWAAAVAAGRHWPLRLVHVFEPYVSDLPIPSRFGIDAPEGISAEVLRRARVHLGDRWPQLEVSEVSREGSVVPVLLDELDHGRWLVLGRRGIGKFAALVAGSTTLACAARATKPVAVIPPADVPEPAGRPVVVGVDGSASGRSAIELAFAEASARGVRLDLVHAWEIPSPFSFDFAAYGGEAAWKREHELAVAEVVAGWRERYPDVEVHTVIEEGHPVAVLAAHGDGAALVVVGGRGHSRLADTLIGSTARAVIQHAPSPVVVAHEPGPKSWT